MFVINCFTKSIKDKDEDRSFFLNLNKYDIPAILSILNH